jgi:hypothetical protein
MVRGVVEDGAEKAGRMILVCVLIVALGIMSGIVNRSVMVGAVPIVWLLWFVLCLRLVQRA